MLNFYDYCMNNGNAALLSRWNAERNGEYTPTNTSYGSHRRVWWRCENGHEWQANIYDVARSGGGCPVCAGKTAMKGCNDLATLYPELRAEWNTDKNDALTPEDVTAGSGRRVWWRCEKGHEWQAAVKDRTILHAGCPYCANRLIIPGFNDLATLCPELVEQWDVERNGGLTPESVSAGSNKMVWWRCEKGHGWQAYVRSRTGRDSGCPYCTGKKVLEGFNDLATVFPTIANQWHPTLNGDMKPTEISPGCNKKVWWICEEGHIWKTSVCARTAKRRHTGCPVCTGFYSRSTLYEEKTGEEGK